MNHENPTDQFAPVESASVESDVKPATAKRRRGFAAMDPKLVVELATRGGKAAHRAGTAHEFTSEEARIAGRKGGIATHAKRKSQAGTPPVVS
jgi:general stress protein YciG